MNRIKRLERVRQIKNFFYVKCLICRMGVSPDTGGYRPEHFILPLCYKHDGIIENE